MLARIQPFFDDRFVFATLTQRKKGSTAPTKRSRCARSSSPGSSRSS